MWFFLNPFALFVGLVIAFWFFFIWFPFRLHIIRIGIKYGWPNAKRAAITRLFYEDKIFAVGYVGGGTGQYDKEFSLVISGPWGQYAKRGYRDYLEEDEYAVLPPPEVVEAFAGYIDHPSDVVHLLWSMSLLERLQEEVPDICASDIWNPGTFTVWKKGSPFVKELEEGDPLNGTLVRIKSEN